MKSYNMAAVFVSADLFILPPKLPGAATHNMYGVLPHEHTV